MKYIFSFALLVFSHLLCAQTNQASKNDSIINHIQMVCVDGGGFFMGSSNDTPVHRVVLNSFYIGKYEVTFAQWAALMGNYPQHYNGCDKCPVAAVSWNDAQTFIRKLNAKTGRHYRLPTEAEWEYAAKGGRKTRNYSYSGGDIPNEVSWNFNNSGRKAHPVGQLAANELGIYDMTGNVMEMCADWYGDYDINDKFNPQGPKSGTGKVARGGCYDFYGNTCSIARRTGWVFNVDDKQMICGFRLAMDTDYSPVRQ